MSRTQKRVVEIRAAEGGADAQLLVSDFARAYGKLFGRLG
jgi:protein subunit release factor A